MAEGTECGMLEVGLECRQEAWEGDVFGVAMDVVEVQACGARGMVREGKDLGVEEVMVLEAGHHQRGTVAVSRVRSGCTGLPYHHRQ